MGGGGSEDMVGLVEGGFGLEFVVEILAFTASSFNFSDHEFLWN